MGTSAEDDTVVGIRAMIHSANSPNWYYIDRGIMLFDTSGLLLVVYK